MKLHTLTASAAAAACAVTFSALPAMAAEQPSGTTIKSRDSGNLSSRSAANSEASSDRRIDFGKPVRFIRNTFSRDNDQSERDTGMNRNRNEDSRPNWRGSQRDDERGMSNQSRNQNDSQNHFWNRGQDRKDDTEMKREENRGFFSRLLNWRPFGRSENQ